MITKKLVKKCLLFQGIIEPISVFIVRHRDYAVYTLNCWQEENLELIPFAFLQHLNSL